MPGSKDPFDREWTAIPAWVTGWRELRALPMDVIGVWIMLVMHSLRESKVPGYFLTMDTGAPMDEDDIAWMVGLRSREEQRFLRDALGQLRQAGVVAFDDHTGWRFERFDDFLRGRNLTGKRAKDAARQSKSRQKRGTQPPRILPFVGGREEM